MFFKKKIYNVLTAGLDEYLQRRKSCAIFSNKLTLNNHQSYYCYQPASHYKQNCMLKKRKIHNYISLRKNELDNNN